MKKIIVILLMVSIVFTALLAQGTTEQKEPVSKGHEPITLKLAFTATMDEHHGACMKTFADYVHEKCPWITIEIYPASTLYDDSNGLAAIMRGNLEIGMTSPGWMGEYAPEFEIFGACYLFDKPEQVGEIMNHEIGEKIFDTVAKRTGLRVLGALYKGRRTINLREDKKVTSREDLNGVLLRVPNAESWMQMGYALGATPTGMALSEVYLALSAGTVDGQDNPLQATMLYGFGEVTKSITMTNHIMDITCPCISEKIWETFDDDTKAVFKEALNIAYDECYNAYTSEEADLIAQFRAMGVKVYDDVDLSVMEKEVWDYYWSHPEISGKWDKSIYEAIKGSH